MHISLYDCYKKCSSKDEFMTMALTATRSSYGGSITDFIRDVIKEDEDILVDMLFTFLNYPSLRKNEADMFTVLMMRRLEELFADMMFTEDYLEEHREEIEEYDCEVA